MLYLLLWNPLTCLLKILLLYVIIKIIVSRLIIETLDKKIYIYIYGKKKIYIYVYGKNVLNYFQTLHLVFWHCRDKLPQMWWFKTIEIYSLTILKARNLKFSKAMLPPEALRDNSFSSSSIFCWLQGFLCDFIIPVCLVVTWPFFCVGSPSVCFH